MDRVTVKPLFRGPEFQTTVWIATDVADAVAEYLREEPEDATKYLDKTRYYARAGFHNHEGDREGIRSKASIAARILAIQPWATLFRLYGFYETDQKKDFIIVSTTYKKGMKLRDRDKEAVKTAGAIREAGGWEKDEP